MGGKASKQQSKTSIRSIERTEYDEIIKSLQFTKMLETDLTNAI